LLIHPICSARDTHYGTHGREKETATPGHRGETARRAAHERTSIITLLLIRYPIFATALFQKYWQLPGFAPIRIRISLLSRVVTHSFSPYRYFMMMSIFYIVLLMSPDLQPEGVRA
jgi:hypothetical protein